jgi:hypothetical protein
MLTMHLAENPLPLTLLNPLPPSIMDASQPLESNVVSVSSDQQQSWWDVLDRLLEKTTDDTALLFQPPVAHSDFRRWRTNVSDKPWRGLKFDYSIVAADVVTLGLSLLKRTQSFALVDGASMARGICRCADAAQSIESRLTAVHNSQRADAMDTEESVNREVEEEYLTILGSKLARCVEEMLVISLMRLRASKEATVEYGKFQEFAQWISTALEFAGIESKGVGCATHPDFGIQICKEIRKEMKVAK